MGVPFFHLVCDRFLEPQLLISRELRPSRGYYTRYFYRFTVFVNITYLCVTHIFCNNLETLV